MNKVMRLYRILNKAKSQTWVAANSKQEAKQVAFNEGRARSIGNLIAEDYTDKVTGDLTVLSVLTKPATVAKWINGRKGIQKWTTGPLGEYPTTQEDRECCRLPG